MDVQCCKCAKVRHEDEWCWTAELSERPISYSYCPECLDEFRGEAGLSRRDRAQSAPQVLTSACA
jgi:uncharacterized protein YlaI